MTLGAVAILAVFIVLLSLLAGWIERLPITAPMLAVVIGLVIAAVDSNEVAITLGSEQVVIVAEVTLILLLFTDAARISSMSLRETGSLPARLLLLGLPLTIGLSVGFAALLLTDLGGIEAALIAVMVTPTDAALGQAVVSSPVVPVRIRHALEVESGLNDGLVVPIVGVLMALADRHELGSNASIVGEALGEIGLGVLIGGAGGYAFGRLGRIALTKMTTDADRLRLGALAAIAGTAGLATALGGNNLIAAFVAGLALRAATGKYCDRWMSLSENLGQLGAHVAFVIFGATMVPDAVALLSWQVALCGVAFLTVARMVPVALALIGSGLHRQSVVFVGWFGPRGLASILFALIFATESMSESSEDVVAVVSLVVLASIFLHGASARPFSKRYGEWVAAHPQQHIMPESQEVPEQRSRPDIASM